MNREQKEGRRKKKRGRGGTICQESFVFFYERGRGEEEGMIGNAFYP